MSIRFQIERLIVIAGWAFMFWHFAQRESMTRPALGPIIYASAVVPVVGVAIFLSRRISRYALANGVFFAFAFVAQPASFFLSKSSTHSTFELVGLEAIVGVCACCSFEVAVE